MSNPPTDTSTAESTRAQTDRDEQDVSSDAVALAISALVAIALAVGSVWVVSGRAPVTETMLRVRPTLAGGGVGADWVQGITEPTLMLLIDLVHLADVIMGVFILLMVFIHWAAFHRLADRMQPPAGTDAATRSEVATDGGADSTASGGDRR